MELDRDKWLHNVAALYWDKSPRYQLKGGWVGPQAILGPMENIKISNAFWELNYDFSVVQVTILT